MAIQTATLESTGTVWAYFRHPYGKEVFAAATANYKEEVLFGVNYRSDLITANVTRYNGGYTISPGLTLLRSTSRT